MVKVYFQMPDDSVGQLSVLPAGATLLTEAAYYALLQAAQDDLENP